MTEKPLITNNDECKFLESDFSNGSYCAGCKTREIKYCPIYENSFKTTKEIFQYKTKCKKAVKKLGENQEPTVYTCGENGGICDVTKYLFCKNKDCH